MKLFQSREVTVAVLGPLASKVRLPETPARKRLIIPPPSMNQCRKPGATAVEVPEMRVAE